MADTVVTNSLRSAQDKLTAGELIAHIPIRPAHKIPLYQRIAPKVTELRLLDMPYQEIATALQVSKSVATRAGGYAKGTGSAEGGACPRS